MLARAIALKSLKLNSWKFIRMQNAVHRGSISAKLNFEKSIDECLLFVSKLKIIWHIENYFIRFLCFRSVRARANNTNRPLPL